MSHLSTNHPNISFHISTDRTPLLSSSQHGQRISDSDGASLQAQALHTLTTTSITAYETARRLGYGAMQRLMIETANNGPVLLQSYLNPASVIPRSFVSDVEATNGLINDLLDVGRPSTGTSEQTISTELANAQGSSLPLTNGFDTNHGTLVEDDSSSESTDIQPPPTLFTTVVVPRRSDLSEGRAVAVRMEQLGRQFQREWVREQVAEREQVLRETQSERDEEE